MQTAKLKVKVNLIGGPCPNRGTSSTEIEIADNNLFSIWPLDLLLPNYNDDRPYARYLFWLPGQYIWVGFASNLTVMNRIRVDKDTLNLMPEALRG